MAARVYRQRDKVIDIVVHPRICHGLPTRSPIWTSDASSHKMTARMTYTPPVAVENAKKAAAAALAEARANNWSMAVAVVDPAGFLVYFERMDGTQNGSVAVAQAKARSAALFKRPTKAFQDMLAAGGEGMRVLALEGAVPIDGGLPIIVDGAVIGAIGLSGGTSAQDGQCAKAGVAALP
jgi:glc operon protein GlcG